MCIEAIEAVLQNSQQSGPRYQLLWVIAWHINKDSGDWPLTVREIANESHTGLRQTYYHLADLEASGELIIAHRPGRRNLYSLSYFRGTFHELSTTPAEIRRGAEIRSCGNPQGRGAEIRRGRGAEIRTPVPYTGNKPYRPDVASISNDDQLPDLPYGGYWATRMDQQRKARLAQ